MTPDPAHLPPSEQPPEPATGSVGDPEAAASDPAVAVGEPSVDWPTQRRGIIRDGAAVGLAVGIYGVSFGALAIAAGFSVWQAMALSALMFTGGSQFAYIGVIDAGGSAVAAAAAALLLGARNSVYAMALAPVLQLRGVKKILGAQLTIDESFAMSTGVHSESEPRAAKTAFWATGIAVFIGWNIFTLVGAAGAASLGDPAKWGLDAMVPAAFLALLWPRLRNRRAVAVALVAAAIAIALIPVTPAGVPIILGGVIAAAAAVWWGRRYPDTGGPS